MAEVLVEFVCFAMQATSADSNQDALAVYLHSLLSSSLLNRGFVPELGGKQGLRGGCIFVLWTWRWLETEILLVLQPLLPSQIEI